MDKVLVVKIVYALAWVAFTSISLWITRQTAVKHRPNLRQNRAHPKSAGGVVPTAPNGCSADRRPLATRS